MTAVMGLNRKLSQILSGRTVEKKEIQPALFKLYFTDGSFLQIKIKGAVSGEIHPGQKIAKVIETEERFVLELMEGARVEVSLAEAGASVYLRDKEGRLEYLG
ncbi:Hypothetical protein Minf_0835 [Methylacidiphilum infernorum V4]|uniref:Uncharacterized protein n=2 Tax=Candidatus Methylacidiphilum infernorum TaxID=511746 RepID=B3E194_METI4|nr:Hypothetical protein Minf_0835 [Methylacidiphilum infernorum V4]